MTGFEYDAATDPDHVWVFHDGEYYRVALPTATGRTTLLHSAASTMTCSTVGRGR